MLVNTYSGDIRVTGFPVKIPFALYVELVSATLGEVAVDFTIKVNNKRLGVLMAEINFNYGSLTGIFAANGITLMFEQECNLVIEAKVGDARKEIIFRKKVSADPSLADS